MKILVLGKTGQVATELQNLTWLPGLNIQFLDRQAVNLLEPELVHATILQSSPNIVVNTAAFTDVDGAESKRNAAYTVNAMSPGVIAKSCQEVSATLIHLSTDYVFSGRASSPYDEQSPVAPLNYYGQTKVEGEDNVRRELVNHVILRTSWIYSAHNKNFVKTMIQLSHDQRTIKIVNDQIGNPTSARSVSTSIQNIIYKLQTNQGIRGTFHYCDQNSLSWFEFAELIFRLSDTHLVKSPELLPISTDEFPTPAERPRFSVLNCTKIAQTLGIYGSSLADELQWVLDHLNQTQEIEV